MSRKRYVGETKRETIENEDTDGNLVTPTNAWFTALVTGVTKVDEQLMTVETVGRLYYDVTFDTAGQWTYTIKTQTGTLVNIEKFSVKVIQP